jgi:hypothetical protein
MFPHFYIFEENGKCGSSGGGGYCRVSCVTSLLTLQLVRVAMKQ